MTPPGIKFILCIIVILLTSPSRAQGPTFKITFPSCPAQTKREFYPEEATATWMACRDEKGFYQGIIIQFSSEKEVIRIASVKDSERNGKEVRTGKQGFLEERTFKNGHLEGTSYVFESFSTIGKILPKTLTPQDWAAFTTPTSTSMMKAWLNQQAPFSTLQFSNGRITRIQFKDKDYRFKITKDGRIVSENHPEMKGGMYFIDPEALWLLNPADLKAAILYGFGSCKKYSGPIGRFGRHFDQMIFKQETTEIKHDRKLKEIRDRFIKFCVPQDMMDHLGKMECPPQLPTSIAAMNCLIPISDQLHIPYHPKFFTFEYTLGRSPEELHEYLRKSEFKKFVSKYALLEDVYTINPTFQMRIKKTGKGVLFQPLEKDEQGRIKVRKNNADGSKDWWLWHRLPGF